MFCPAPQAIAGPPLWFPAKLPGATIDQGFDLAQLIPPLANVDVATLGVQIAPSGAGEMACATLDLVGSVATLSLSGGRPGRVYSILFTAVKWDGETAQWIVRQGVSPIPPPTIIPPAPTPGFGTEIVWMPTSNNVASIALSSALLLSPTPVSVVNIQASTTTIGGWVILLDAAAIPPDGTVAPLRWWQLPPGETLPVQTFSPPLRVVNGAVLAFSSALSPFTLTSSATALFAGQIA